MSLMAIAIQTSGYSCSNFGACGPWLNTAVRLARHWAIMKRLVNGILKVYLFKATTMTSHWPLAVSISPSYNVLIKNRNSIRHDVKYKLGR
jgi:hypothetical protein